MHRSGEGWKDTGEPGEYNQDNLRRNLLGEAGALAQAAYFLAAFQARVNLAKSKGTLAEEGLPGSYHVHLFINKH